MCGTYRTPSATQQRGLASQGVDRSLAAAWVRPSPKKTESGCTARQSASPANTGMSNLANASSRRRQGVTTADLAVVPTALRQRVISARQSARLRRRGVGPSETRGTPRTTSADLRARPPAKYASRPSAVLQRTRGAQRAAGVCGRERLLFARRKTRMIVRVVSLRVRAQVAAVMHLPAARI